MSVKGLNRLNLDGNTAVLPIDVSKMKHTGRKTLPVDALLQELGFARSRALAKAKAASVGSVDEIYSYGISRGIADLIEWLNERWSIELVD